MMDRSCSMCMFGHVANPKTIECRRHAPRPVVKDAQMEMPRLPPDFWCGEFEGRDVPARRGRKAN